MKRICNVPKNRISLVYFIYQINPFRVEKNIFGVQLTCLIR